MAGHADDLVWARWSEVPTSCEECGHKIVLDCADADGTLIGGECVCGYYVTRYQPGQAPQ